MKMSRRGDNCSGLADAPRKHVIGDESARPGFKSTVPAAEQASRVLFCLGENPDFKMRLTDICNRIGISKSKAHAILDTLRHFELVEKDPRSKTYSLGPALIFLSQRVLDNLTYPEIAAPFLESLVQETDGTAAFGLISDMHVFVIAKREGNLNIGFRMPLGHKIHFTLGAPGKAIVAHMDEAQREKLLARKQLYFYGESSRMNVQRLRTEIAECKRLGFAQDLGEIIPGVIVLSAPVFGTYERMVACLMLFGSFDASKVQEYGTNVALAARQISHKLGAQVDLVSPL